jgi:hypothetical protein
VGVGALHAKRLGTYLNDHLAAATGGVELAKRTRGSNEGPPYGELLAAIERDLTDDKARLLEVMQRLDVDKNPVKEGLGWFAEKLGRLKPNDQLTGYSPLSRVVELEGLMLILTANLALWRTLDHVAATELDGIDLTALAERAQGHRDALEPLRLTATAEALRG